MNKMQKAFSGVMAALFVTAGIVGTNPVKAADATPKINFVGVDHSPLIAGDTETFTLTANYDGDVQYRAYLYTEKSKKWQEVTTGYSAKVNGRTPFELKYEKPFELGKYKLSILVKKADVTGEKSVTRLNAKVDYDSEYVVALNTVNKDDKNRVYANGNLQYKLDGLKLTVTGIEGIGGIEGPYQYKLHLFNPATGEWIKNATPEYTENGLQYTFAKAGTYVIDVHVNTKNSTTWKKYEADKTNTKGTYEAWKLAVVQVKDSAELPKATVSSVQDGTSPFDRYVEIKLDTDKPADYKVTVLGTELKYVEAKKVFAGLVFSSDEAAIKAGTKVESLKPVAPVAVKATVSKIEAGVSSFERYVQVKLDTDKPENYKVTVLGTVLEYVESLKLFHGTVSSTDETAIKAGAVATAK